MVSVLIPYWIAVFRIKGDLEITPEYAEMLLKAPDMDVVNTPYNDLICITGSFFLVFFAPGNLHFQLFAGLAFFAAFTYAVARKRLLAWQTSITLGDRYLHDTASCLWSLPLGLLAAN